MENLENGDRHYDYPTAVEEGVQLNLGQTWERHVHVGVQHLDQLGSLGARGSTHVQDLHRGEGQNAQHQARC